MISVSPLQNSSSQAPGPHRRRHRISEGTGGNWIVGGEGHDALHGDAGIDTVTYANGDDQNPREMNVSPDLERNNTNVRPVLSAPGIGEDGRGSGSLGKRPAPIRLCCTMAFRSWLPALTLRTGVLLMIVGCEFLQPEIKGLPTFEARNVFDEIVAGELNFADEDLSTKVVPAETKPILLQLFPQKSKAGDFLDYIRSNGGGCKKTSGFAECDYCVVKIDSVIDYGRRKIRRREVLWRFFTTFAGSKNSGNQYTDVLKSLEFTVIVTTGAVAISKLDDPEISQCKRAFALIHEKPFPYSHLLEKQKVY